MEIVDNELTEMAVLIDGRGEDSPERVARFEQLLDEKSELELTETMATVCGVNIAAFRVYITILDHPHSTITEIAEILDRDQSTIGTQLKPLYEEKLVNRYPRTVSNGGIKYLHVAQPLAETREWLQHELKTWMESALNQLEQLHTT
jgi:predicted transcriptional regulator